MAKLGACACEFAHDQNSALIGLSSAKFFSYKIHSILKRGDERNVRGTIVGEKLIATEIAVHVMDGHPAGLSKLAVDLADQQFHIEAQVFVIRNFLAAGNDHLHQGDLVAQFGVAAEQDAKRFEPLWNSLCVIHAINAEHENVFHQFTANLGGTRIDFGTRGCIRELIEINADGKGYYDAAVSLVGNNIVTLTAGNGKFGN